ncbi:MAG: MFS transporter [Anaerolineales bacterium]
MSLLRDKLFSSIALGHLMVDLLNGTRAVLLTFISKPFGLSNADIGLISTLYVTVASITQPVYGWITDRVGPRWLAAGGLLWMMSFFGLAMLASGPYLLVYLILASLGSAALHPAGAMQATRRGQTHYAGRETTSASFFFMFGQMGFFLGPIVAGPLLERFGLPGLLIPAALCLPISLNIGWQLRDTKPVLNSSSSAAPVVVRYSAWFIAALVIVAVLQAWAQQNMITFVPKYLSDLGQAPAAYGFMSGLFMGGSALGNVLGGTLADRFGRQRVATVALTLSSISLYIFSSLGWSPWLYALIPLSGALTGSVHSIVVVMAQRIIRGGMALASGLTLGIMFSAGTLGTLISGHLADTWGFPPVFQMTAGLVFVAALFTLCLNETPKK